MFITGNRTLPDLLASRTRNTPHKPLLIFAGETDTKSYSYGEVELITERLAGGLQQNGIGRGDKVLLHLSNCPEFVFLWFALAKLAAVMVPTNPIAPVAELAYLAQHSEAKAIFTDQANLAKIRELVKVCPKVEFVAICGDSSNLKEEKPFAQLLALNNPPSQEKPDPLDVLAVMYTSGTTAKPKGVMITHANYLYVGEVIAKHLRLSPDDRHLVVLPLFHANAQYYSFMSAITVGASVALMPRFSASQFSCQAKRHEATVASIFAAPIRMILKQPPTQADAENRLRVVIFAQNVTENQAKEFEARFNVPLLQLYGMTETVGVPTINPLDGIRKSQSIGLPALGYEIRVVDSQGQDVIGEQPGEIWVRGTPGITLMGGYFKDPQNTAKTLKEGWLYTGDIARIDPEGYLYFVDRAKDMIKRAGENVAAAEVEAVVNQHPAVFESSAIGVTDEMRDQAVKIFVVLKDGCHCKEAEIIAFCRQRLSKFKVPSFVEFIPELPRTSVGKIMKHLLRSDQLR